MSKIRAINIILEKFSNPQMNGAYLYGGYHDGKPYYTKKVFGYEKKPYEYLLIYKKQNGPYSFEPAWYLTQITDNKLEKPIYKNKDINLDDNSWEPILEPTSGEIETSGFTSKRSYVCAKFYFYNSSDKTGTDLFEIQYKCVDTEELIRWKEIEGIPINEVFLDNPTYFLWFKDMKIEIDTVDRPDAAPSEWILYTEGECIGNCVKKYACVTFYFYNSIEECSLSSLFGEATTKCLDKEQFDSFLKRKAYKLNECFLDLPPSSPSSFGWGKLMLIEYDPDIVHYSYEECLEYCLGEDFSSSSSSESYYESSSSSGFGNCIEGVNLALNFPDSPFSNGYEDVSEVNHRLVFFNGAFISNEQAYVSSHSIRLNAADQYALVKSKDELEDPNLEDNYSCFNFGDKDFDIRIAFYPVQDKHMTLISKWGGAPDRGWSIDYWFNPDVGASSLDRWVISFSWTTNGDDEGGIINGIIPGGDPLPLNNWYEVRVARVSNEIVIQLDGSTMSMTNANTINPVAIYDTIHSTPTAVSIGNNIDDPGGWAVDGYVDYVFIENDALSISGGTCDYTPEKLPFTPPLYISNIGCA